ncbi:cation:proton antiporter domain-containing protein, partial [Rhodoblastus sp.]
MPEFNSETNFLVPILILLAAAMFFAPIFRLARLGSVIGYLPAGVVIGPSGMRLISDARMTLDISQLGVVLLLFLIGLSLKPQRLYALRRDIGLIRFPHDPCGNCIPLARKSARDIEDFRAMAFPRIAKQSCGNR